MQVHVRMAAAGKLLGVTCMQWIDEQTHVSPAMHLNTSHRVSALFTASAGDLGGSTLS